VKAVRDRRRFLKDVFGPETRSGAAPLGQARPRYFGITLQPLKVIQPGFLSCQSNALNMDHIFILHQPKTLNVSP
jgi:hypothetical protein